MGLWHRHRHAHWWRHHGHRHDDHRHHGRYKWWKKYGYHYPSKLSSSHTVSKFVEEEREVKESVSSTEEIYERDVTYVRSRNVEFDTTSLKPFTFFTPFFSSVEVYDNVVPKLLEVTVTNGNFIPGETIESSDTFVGDKFIARLCTANHKEGPYTDPTKTYTLNPYTRQEIQEQYSESSTFLNIDTKSLELPSETEFYGSVKVGMTLNGKLSGASAVVSDIRLISDLNGRLIGSFFIPDPNTSGNPKFNNGTNTFSLLDVGDLSLSDEARSIAEAEYYTMGTENVTENIITTTRDIKVTPAHTQTKTTIKNVRTSVPHYFGYYGVRALRSIVTDMELILGDLVEAENQEAKIFESRKVNINDLSGEGEKIGSFKLGKFKYRFWNRRKIGEGFKTVVYLDNTRKNQKLEEEYLEIFRKLNERLLKPGGPIDRVENRRGGELEQSLDFVNTDVFSRLENPNTSAVTQGTFSQSRLADLNELKSLVNKSKVLLPRIGIRVNEDGSIEGSDFVSRRISFLSPEDN